MLSARKEGAIVLLEVTATIPEAGVRSVAAQFGTEEASVVGRHDHCLHDGRCLPYGEWVDVRSLHSHLGDSCVKRHLELTRSSRGNSGLAGEVDGLIVPSRGHCVPIQR